MTVAEDLIELSHFEDAINRMYYAMFLAATAILLYYNIQRSSRYGLIAAFGEFIAKPGYLDKKYHRYLMDALNVRSESDYFPLPEVSEQEAKVNFEHAREFVDAVDAHIDVE